MRQLPKLFIRGRRYRELQDFTEEQQQQIEELVARVRAMPEMQPCRREFCRALSSTIGGDYRDEESAMVEFDVAAMRCAVTVLFWDPVAGEVLNDPIQMKKIFSQWVFNYLRQILRENKRPTVVNVRKKMIRGDAAVVQRLCEILTANNVQYEMLEGESTTLLMDTDRCPLDLILTLNLDADKAVDADAVRGFVDLVKEAECQLKTEHDRIVVTPLSDKVMAVDEKTKDNVRSTSLEIDEDDCGRHDHVEYLVSQKREPTQKEEWDYATARQFLSEEAALILDIMRNPPLRFLEQNDMDLSCPYSSKAIARYLEIPKAEVDRQIGLIRLACILADVTTMQAATCI